MSKLITIFGATGNQGGSVITSILADPVLSKEFKIRGITRDTSKPAAQALVAKGVEIVAADLNSPDSVTNALTGSHTVFLVTNYWEYNSRAVEVTQGKTVVDVAKTLGVQHLIFSSLLDVTEASKGRLTHVPHFDGKAEIEQYIRDSGVPATFYLPGYFMSNLDMMIRAGEDGVLTWALPVGQESRFPLLEVAKDTGKFVAGIIHNRSSLLGSRILGATDYYTPKQILDTLSTVTGKPTKFVQVPGEVYKGFLPEFMAEEMLENHLFVENPGYFAGEGLEKSHAILKEKLTTLEEYLKASKAF
ncbi:NmrA family transcriptional regulator [Plenodomus tracheiphilus IPT5]|uniref:NmrA-like family domain-containing protein 1 n=1 Tax=Plenodomus tracheiphilus IPT5 TaxID=1408161 RepID=A0A6A7AN44_9PLEO|nr:NmrA family transcriptional regulator [Plenodomus tracheiphilus IPT5]